MGFRRNYGFAFTTILGLFALAAISLQLRNGTNKQLNVLVTSHVQSLQYNISSLSQEPHCGVHIIYNLATSGLKQIQDERKSRIRDVCSMCRGNGSSVGCIHVAPDTDYRRSFESFYANLVVDDKHKVIYCFIPRVGCGTWKRTIARSYTGKEENISESKIHTTDFMSEHGMKRLYLYSDNGIQMRLKKYFKFLVVRNPLQRFVSAFRDRFESETQSEFRNNARDILKKGKKSDLPLFNFIEYISSVHRNRIDSDKKGVRYLEGQWAQYSTLCHPCHIDYDYIVKFETMREDAAYVLSKLGPHHDKCLEDKYPELFHSSESTSSVFNQYYSSLTSEQTKILRDVYSLDFKLFGYKM